jgi:EAL domain-containing protein (putative c-di-GMP-specific phosphodiesterase class I)
MCIRDSLWDGTREIEDVALVAKKLLGCLEAPVVVDGRSLTVSASIGISVYPGDGVAFADLLKNADAARHSARQAEGNTYRFFSRELNTRAVERLEMESALHRALARDEFLLRYQPVVRSVSSAAPRLVGAEVMLFWRHPQKGLLAPDEFFPFARQAGLMSALDQRLIEQAFAQIVSWDAQGKHPVHFALNISGRQFTDGARFFELVCQALQSSGLDGSRIEFEVSESSLPEGEMVGDVLGALTRLGVSLTVDGFGAGQSSLAALRQLPIRKLKIDRGLIAGGASDEPSPVLIATTMAIARSLGLTVAAEGIESEMQLARVRAAGCEEWQGRLYSEPLEAEAFSALLAKMAHAASA